MIWENRSVGIERLTSLVPNCHHVACAPAPAKPNENPVDLMLYCDIRCQSENVAKNVECDRENHSRLYLIARVAKGRPRFLSGSVIRIEARIVSKQPGLALFCVPQDSATASISLELLPFCSSRSAKARGMQPGEITEDFCSIRVIPDKEFREALVIANAKVWNQNLETFAPDNQQSLTDESKTIATLEYSIRMNLRIGLPSTGRRYRLAISYASVTFLRVKSIYDRLQGRHGADQIFFDREQVSYLADASLKSKLQSAYEKESDLYVLFLSESFAKSDWCLEELEYARKQIFREGGLRVLFISLDGAKIEGVDPDWGTINASVMSDEQVANVIESKLQEIQEKSK